MITQQKGTLILSVPYDKGLLICADRLRRRLNDEMTEDVTKIHRLGNTALSSSGALIVSGKTADGSERTLFSADTIIRRYFFKCSRSGVGVEFQSLFDLIRDNFKRNIIDQECLDAITFPTPPDYLLWQSTFFSVDPQNQIEILQMVVTFHKEQESPLTFRLETRGEVASPKSAPWGFGFFYVLRELEQGSKPEFEDLRNHSLIRRLLIDRDLRQNVTLDDAMEFAKIVTRATYERWRLVDRHASLQEMNYNPVGSTVDIAALDSRRGFIWHKRGHSVL